MNTETADLRKLFPHTAKGMIYLNHASISPLPLPVTDSLKYFIDNQSFGKIDFYSEIAEKILETRSLIAKMINANKEEISFHQNTSEGLNFLTNAIQWKRGDRVITYEQEFPAITQPLMNLKKLGIEIDVVKSRDGRLDADDILRAIKPNTHLVCISHVQFLNGYKTDLETIGKYCNHRGIIFSVDAIQSCGITPIDVKKMKIDFLVCGAQKWLMSPQGIGFMFVSEELRSMITQPNIGWTSVEKPFDFFNPDNLLLSDSRRYEIGTLNMLGIYGLHSAIKLLTEIGLTKVEKRIRDVILYLLTQLNAMSYRTAYKYDSDNLSGIVSFYVQDPSRIAKKLLEQNIHVAPRDKYIRISPHFYNTKEEIDQMLSAVKAVDYKIKSEKAQHFFNSNT